MDKFCTSVIEAWEILRQAANKKIVLFGTGKRASKFFAFHGSTDDVSNNSNA